jgi:hypothetical protein
VQAFYKGIAYEKTENIIVALEVSPSVALPNILTFCVSHTRITHNASTAYSIRGEGDVNRIIFLIDGTFDRPLISMNIFRWIKNYI